MIGEHDPCKNIWGKKITPIALHWFYLFAPDVFAECFLPSLTSGNLCRQKIDTVGSLKSGRHRRLIFSRTKYDGNQWAHTHPYLTADNRWLIFNSTRSGHAQVYGAVVPEGFLESL